MTAETGMRFTNLGQFIDELEAMGDAASAVLVDAAMMGAYVVLTHVRLNIRKRGLIDTSNYVNSWYVTVLEGSPTKAVAAAATDVIYGPIHEYGGVIKPRNAVFLAIPVGNLKGSPRQYDLNLACTRSGQWLLVDQAGNVQYLLKKAVTIPARPHVRPAIDENKTEINARMAAVIRQGLRRWAKQ